MVPDGLLQAALPGAWSAVVAMNIIGHFTAVERQEIWRVLAERPAPEGRAVVNLQPSTEPTAIPEALAVAAENGRGVYKGWARAELTDNEMLKWYMAYRTHGRRAGRRTRSRLRLTPAERVPDSPKRGRDCDCAP